MSKQDDDALTWAGDPDRDTTNITWSAPKARKSSTSRSSSGGLSRPQSGRIETPGKARSSSGGVAAVSRRKKDGFDTPTASATQPATTNANVELIVTAVFAACYLLITVAWLIVALRNPLAIADPVGNAMFTLGLWAAVAAGPLVCGGIVVLAKHQSLLKRLLLFVLGILVLIPWPYLAWAS
ncbi:hypothetical protein GM51_5160 [freshwater metagenome]|uniref:DNA polymerase III subunit gamma/tau n=1 Tax=freshwater metagenome TaxID=449393 RepID=A0A094QAX4_9ZZZZ